MWYRSVRVRSSGNLEDRVPLQASAPEFCGNAVSDNLLFDALTRGFPGLVWIFDANGRIEFINSQWTDFTGLPTERALGIGWLEAVHPDDATMLCARLPLDDSDTNGLKRIIRIRAADCTYHRHISSIRQVSAESWIGCAFDAHDWLTAEVRDATHGTILQRVTSGTELSELLDEVCLAAERQVPGATCSINQVDAKAAQFIAANAPNLPHRISQSVVGLSIAPGIGSCGTAAFTKRDVICPDIASDPLWDGIRELILPLGLRSCWSQPIFSSEGEVIATFGCYLREARAPSAAEMQEIARFRSLATLAIERARMLEALRESEAHYRHTVEQNPQIPWTADPAGKLLSLSPRWTELTGIALDEAFSQGLRQAQHADDIAEVMRTWEVARQSGQPFAANYRLRLQTGAYIWVRTQATPRRDAAGAVIRWYGTIEDIHEKHTATEMLRRQAYHDDLTGLPNRRSFTAELKARLQSGEGQVGLLVLDMDHFKQVNDRYGHQTGDAVLRLFARHLLKLATGCEFVARLGGDEFAIILSNIRSDDDILTRAGIIESALEVSLKRNKKSRVCRPSIGCALGCAGDSPDELFKRADMALYAVKEAAKGGIRLFDQSISSAATRRSEAFDLARLALREGWIEPFYQPVIDMRSGVTRGYEALLRIRHPERGILLPELILEALDDPGLADSIGIRMSEMILADMSPSAPGGSLKGQVSINVGTENLIQSHFAENLLRLLYTHNVSHQAVKLEITERVLMNQLNHGAIERLTRLRNSGIGIALDDFGTGYASLIHLKALPVDEIKIDRSFVSGLGTGVNKGEIVAAMLGLARTLGLVTVAEGVETNCEARQLQDWGCDYAQGYLFGHPVPAAQAKSLK